MGFAPAEDGEVRRQAAPTPRPSPDAPADKGPDREDPGRAGSRRSRGANRPKMSFYQDPRNSARLRSAVFHTMEAEQIRSLSQFVDDAVMSAVRRLEARYNEGRPFPPVPPGALPRGRPVRRIS